MNDSSSSPKLDLPSRQEWGLPPEKRGGGGTIVLAVLLLGVIGLQAYGLFGKGPAPVARPEVSSSPDSGPFSGIKLRDLAARLQRNNLPGAAAQVLRDHLETLPAEDRERRHSTLLTMGNLLLEANLPREALVRLFQAEALDPGGKNQQHIDLQVTRCLEKLGRFDEMSYELADRTGGGAGGDASAGEVVAQIGLEKITTSQLDAIIGHRADLQVASLAGLPEEERQAYRKQIIDGFREPRRRLQILQDHVMRKVLYREGAERALDRDEAVKTQLSELRESLVAQAVVRQRLASVEVSPADIENFFKAQPLTYQIPAATDLRLATLPDEAAARKFLTDAAGDVKKFEALVKERSSHAASRDTGGALSAPLAEGAPVPGLGPAPGLHRALAATAAGKSLADPVQVGEAWVVAHVVTRTPARQPSFEEVRERVARDYTRQKEAEVQGKLIQELFEKHRVNIHNEAFLPPAPAEGTSGTSPAPKTPPPPGGSSS